MLRPEIGSPELDLMKPIFHARNVRIPTTGTGQFLSDFSKFEAFNAQELDDTMVLQVHRIDTFDYLQFLSWLSPSVFPREISNGHSIHEFPSAIAGASFSHAGKGETH
jgi:hypothetical protein